MTKKRVVFLVGVGIAVFRVGQPTFAGDIDPGLEHILQSAPPDQSVSTLVYLSDRVDLAAVGAYLDRIMAPRPLRHKVVVEALRAKADQTQGGLVAYLHSRHKSDAVESYKTFWITNVIRVDALPAEIVAIAGRDDVERVYFNYEVQLIGPSEPLGATVPPGSLPARGGAPSLPRVGDGNRSPTLREDGAPPASGAQLDPEPGIRIIQADRVWNELGITGDGVLVANIDTGVDGNHPAFSNRWRGVADPRYEGHPEWAWFDPFEGRNDFPYDDNGHGTHTMGTACGGRPGEQIGVAPGAQWVAAASINRGGGIERTVVDTIKSFQWMADPDGNPETCWDVPNVCSNSWGLTTGHGFPDCDETFWEFIDASEAAGTVQLFAAGGGGPRPRSVSRPADRAATDYDSLAVSACDPHHPDCPVASFSSRGPSKCTPDGRDAIKPEITAPGVNVRSARTGGGYLSMSGTSMAVPHIDGVVALMLEANPNLLSNEVKQIIYDSATDKGEPGEDNNYGWGLVNAYDAVVEAMGAQEPHACCFDNGDCEDLLWSDCVDRGGKPKGGKTCDTFDCPRVGACCINNWTCEIMLERACLAQGGDFMGEGAKCRRACPCDLIKRFKAKCAGDGTIRAIVKFKNKSRNGETVTISIGEQRFEVTIHGRKAKQFACCFHGPVKVSLIDPDGCRDPVIVECPE